MPGWHEDVRDLVADRRLVLLGVTQEQHAERCRLFAQWKQFSWPILHDPINLLASKAVPLVVAIDEHGVVRNTRPTVEWVRDEFVTQSYASAGAAPKAKLESVDKLRAQAEAADNAASYRQLGDGAILWAADHPDLAVNAYNSALQKEDSPVHHFRLGVALRHRHDSPRRQQSDFVRAVTHWTAALSADPNQYIWRRRIQQYGPRLIKPYPFYDWVDGAINEIAARGEQPISLLTALSDAEIAHPAKEMVVQDEYVVSPDPTNRITRDNGQFVGMNVAAVPARISPGESIRLHLELIPIGGQAVWNNESEPLRVWIDETPGWTPQIRLITFGGTPEAAESDEVRRLEVEFQSSSTATDQSIRGFALYYICDKATGTCMLRRQDFAFHANIR